MINANELRIGNWVYKTEFGSDKEEKRLYIIKRSHIDFTFTKAYFPIPLTPEILVKAGFNLAPQRISIYLKGRIKLWLGNNGVIAYLKKEDTDESYFIPNNPKSLHQLQNLYFALTGEELDIKM